VYKSKPAPDNLEIPPYKYLSDAKIIVGEDGKA
jgi:ubiquinol-cytochrome c reductase iron-sulfur subunit